MDDVMPPLDASAPEELGESAAPELRLLSHVPTRMWLVEYPVRFALMTIRARTTIVRLRDGSLFVHSPCPLTLSLRAALIAYGPIRHVIAPGNYHSLHVAAWAQAYPDAEIWLCPGLERKLPELTRARILSDEAPPAWRDEIDQVVVRGNRVMREVIFFDRVSRTLIVTDAIENYGDRSSDVPRLLPVYFRLFRMWNRPKPAPEYQLGWRDKQAARASLERALRWDFERIVLSHGDLVAHDARDCARRAWQSLLDK